MWKAGLLEYDNKKGLDWEWQVIDGAMTKAPLGGAGTGANPTDRGKKGTKRSILTDSKGIPLSVTVDGANHTNLMRIGDEKKAMNPFTALKGDPVYAIEVLREESPDKVGTKART